MLNLLQRLPGQSSLLLFGGVGGGGVCGIAPERQDWS